MSTTFDMLVNCALSKLTLHKPSIHFRVLNNFELCIFVSSSVKCSRDPSKFYADKLHGFVVSGDTASLARVILSSSKVSRGMFNHFSGLRRN